MTSELESSRYRSWKLETKVQELQKSLEEARIRQITYEKVRELLEHMEEQRNQLAKPNPVITFVTSKICGYFPIC